MSPVVLGETLGRFSLSFHLIAWKIVEKKRKLNLEYYVWFMLFLFTKNWNAHNTYYVQLNEGSCIFYFFFVSIPCSKSMGSRF